ncbi:MAG TPA: 7-cyano-7-deazaguanine synthase [Elusimicrobiota bacterium]|jgi:7-cyano-7-deazaguanine synthase in queuosine biosynthesis|nr:7-cyano-7-deazaguanine synthase [Elusimicrobiota bacterium]
MARKICVLASGGIDSSALVADFLRRGREVFPLYVSCGFYWEKAELAWLRRYLRALRGPRLRPLTVTRAPMRSLLPARHWALTGRGVPASGDAWDSVYLPARNMVLLGQAGVFCAVRGIPEVALAILKGNPFDDATPRFLKTMERALSLSLSAAPKVRAPYLRLTKAQVVRRAGDAPLRLSFPCLKPRGLRECGRCSKCEEKAMLGMNG